MTPGDELLFLALGGSGEIGMNVNLYGCRGKWLMVDCGATFPDANYPGIELILPDLEFIEARRDELLGIVLTHGHEDHIGALPYLALDLGVPLYAGPFTAALIARKLAEEGIADRITLNIVDLSAPLTLGPFRMDWVPLPHSIAEMHALAIATPHGTVFHTGDWKVDDSPVIDRPTGEQALTAIGDRGVLALVCDSTNVFNPQPSGSEASVRDGLQQVVATATGRVVVTTFASNIARLQTLGEIAQATGRKLCLAGRSLHRYLEVAQANGYLRKLPQVIDPETAMKLPAREVLVLATGGQGEPRAALARIAEGSHPIKLDARDLVVFSSRHIPGNEIAIGRVQNLLARAGVPIVTERQAHVHVSGHPGRPELLALYGWLRPDILVPVHGERRHMAEQARLGEAAGIPQNIVQENGDLWRLAPGAPTRIGRERAGRLVLDGDVILPADGVTLNERRRVAQNGLVAVSIAVGTGGKVVGTPAIAVQGLPVEEDRTAFVAEAIEAATAAARGGRAPDQQREAVRLAVRRCATRWTGKKPVVEVLVIAV